MFGLLEQLPLAHVKVTCPHSRVRTPRLLYRGPMYFEGARLLRVWLFHKRVTCRLENCQYPPLLANQVRNTRVPSIYRFFAWLDRRMGANNPPRVQEETVRQEGQTLSGSLPFLV